MVLSSTADLIEGRVGAAAINKVHWGAWQEMTTVLLLFPELELELELLGSGYNADLTNNEMEVFWTRTYQASESLLLRVPPSVAHNPPDDTRE
jgi:hypothetical protein